MPISWIFALAVFLVSMALVLAARLSYGVGRTFDLEVVLTEQDNPAIGVALFGYIAAVIIVQAALVSEVCSHPMSGPGLASAVFQLLLYGTMTMLLLRLASWINDRLLLPGFENRKELIEDRNIGAGAALAGTYVATGLVLAGAFPERMDASASPELTAMLPQVVVALLLFALGQLSLWLFTLIYRRVQQHDLIAAIEQDYEVDGVVHGGNAAAGLALAGNHIAMGLVLYGATRGDFTGWLDMLQHWGAGTVYGLLVIPAWRLFVQAVMLRQANLADEIYRDRNTNAALLEGTAVVAVAMMYIWLP